MIDILPLETKHIPYVKEIVIKALFEYQITPVKTIQEAQTLCFKKNSFIDLENFETFYNQNKGIFLVMLDNNKVIGMGGILHNSRTVCELRRLFFDKAYRGKGLGSLMLKTLLDHAKKFGYHYLRLEVYNKLTQKEAVNLYKKFGFYIIDPYRTNLPPNALSMEKKL